MTNVKRSISIVIPSFNASKCIKACILSLKNQTYAPCEIIVVNDASTDRTAEVVSQLDVIMLDQEENGGAGSARHAGVKVAQGDIVAFIDSDCIAPSNWIEKIVSEFEADSSLGLVGGIYQHSFEFDQISSVKLLCLFEESYFWYISSQNQDKAFPPGGNFAVLKKTWNQDRSGLELKLFKGIASGEDTLVCSELKKSNKLKFTNSLLVQHNLSNHWKTYFKRHINRGISRATLIANKLTITSDITVNAYGGNRLMASSLFLCLAILCIPALPFFPIECIIFGGILFLAQHWLSREFFDLCKVKFLNPRTSKKLSLFQLLKLRLGLLARIFCWLLGFFKGFYRHWFSKFKLLWNVVFSVIHFWVPGRISKLFYFVTSKCNARCDFCFNLENVINWESRNSNELRFDEISKIAVKFGRLPYITLSGGEPFMRKDLTKIIREFHEKAKTQWVTIPTNGAITENTVNAVREILQECPGLFLTVQVSIDGLFEDHDKSRKLSGGFTSMAKTLRELAKIRKSFRNLRIQINTCVDSFNIEQIQQIISYCKTNFEFDQQLFYLIRKTNELITTENNHLTSNFFEIVNANEEREWNENRKTLWNRVVRVLQGLTYQDLADIKLTQKFIRPCYATEKFVTLYDDGEVSPCEVLEEKVKYGNIRDFGYDYYKLQKQPKVQRYYKKEIIGNKCNCEWMCALPINMLYSKSTYARIFKGLMTPGKI
jgi:MoaA/NifB/PqqE/SkfB family radical SAM enzyme/glycosyltransferase involved in cell wall biosynthesis